jgi:hypothetical protein
MSATVSITGGVEVEIGCLGDASRTVRADIVRQGVGSSQWCRRAGLVRVDGRIVAHVSYNGRAWLGAKRGKISPEIGDAEFQSLARSNGGQ